MDTLTWTGAAEIQEMKIAVDELVKKHRDTFSLQRPIEESEGVVDRRYYDLIINTKPVYGFFKRFFDIVLSVLALIVLGPYMLYISHLIKKEDRKPTIFKQERVGMNGSIFEMYKFRSMKMGADTLRQQMSELNEMGGPAFKLSHDPRTTAIGEKIRRTGADELPQLLNIIKGEMSIVGPRPLPTYEQDQCDEYQNQRLLVKPGLVCFWQSNPNKNEISFDEWIELDLKYITERSLWTDIKIIFITAFGGVLRNNK